jgi:histidyl-tRNA synthetase
MHDILGKEALEWHSIETIALRLATLSGYSEIRTPLLENTLVFHRTLGETSDAVQKETYTFVDRGGESVTLRPEGTAAVVRALLSNGLIHELPMKFFYMGPMFRYERPQKGRLRQFHQIGVEALGYSQPWSDVDSIALGYQILAELGLTPYTKLELNTLGDQESRASHREAFVNYLSRFQNSLSPDSKVRLEKNPLRIFDSKDPKDQEILEDAPKLPDYLNDSSKKFFDQVVSGLQKLNINPVISPRLVRGFDYYSHTVFEFTTDLLGAQSAVLAGGRYNHLISDMGGPETGCIGWAAGLERLHLLSKNFLKLSPPPSLMLLPLEETAITNCLQYANQFRRSGIMTDLIVSGKLAKRIQKAEKRGYSFIGIVGTTELESNSVTIKNLTTGDQSLVDVQQVSQFILARLK